MTFGEKLRLERKRVGLTQAELAEKIGVSRQVVVEYEKNKMRPRGLERHKKIADVLHVSLEYLLSDKNTYYAETVRMTDNLSTDNKQTRKLIEQAAMLFSGGELSEVDKDTLMMALQDAYWEAKRKSNSN